MLRSMERSNSVCVPYVDEFTSREFIEAAVRVRQRQRSESLEAGRRSPSAISSSVATSRISFASGGAEALRRRREELFGKRKRRESIVPMRARVVSPRWSYPPTRW
ncbi:hypothetical protein AGDE_15272 [Angomonas deanei]|uniref:Uncharacterized protein n=1 Tax=Angomonas deanei TaxID=59799 RepID=A0A7G2CT59_9TRYP|nr:hypothetical protein AGDE_15272 [Angomonas deanei]CAD2222695.1 hypothetical protein, conserved [Angomonas deanei]|eukprot:EPY19373.1 hypothetical protein AGDE_15272 [Angomonas deanei]